MKTKILTHVIAVLTIALFFSSCKKEIIDGSTVNAFANNTATNSKADPSRMHIVADLTGITFRNDCTLEEMLVLSGTLNFNSHQNGTVASVNIHNFVLQSSDGTIYRGIFVQTFQVTSTLPDPGAFNNTYKAIFTTAGGGNNSVLKGVFHITENANGEFAVVIDNFTAGCK